MCFMVFMLTNKKNIQDRMQETELNRCMREPFIEQNFYFQITETNNMK